MLSILYDLFFPRICQACHGPLEDSLPLLCLGCRLDLPYTNYHLEQENALAKTFYGRVPLASAQSFLYFKKGGKVQRMLHAIKYKEVQELAILLGEMYGQQLRDSNLKGTDISRFDGIVPVPLHRKKLKRRGYNQSELLAQGLSGILEKPVWSQAIVRNTYTDTQTKKARFARWENVSTVFSVQDHETLQGKHVLLVDDVITTGATIEACAQVLLTVPDVRVSVACIATPSM